MIQRLLCSLSIILLSLVPAGCETHSKDRDNPSGGLPTSPQQPSATDTLRLQAELFGQYSKELRIEPGDWSAIGPGEEIALTFTCKGMQEIGQFDLMIAVEPFIQFDIDASVFVPTAPILTLGAGLEQLADDRLPLIGVDFQRSTYGDAELGTLRLKTPADFSKDTELQLRVVFFSIGPTSTKRDTYQGDDLRLGVVVNGR